MTRGASAFSTVSTAKLLALVVMASAVGPMLDWMVWPTSKEVEQGFYEGIVNLLWPTKILALGAPSLSSANVALLALTNTFLYFLVCGLSIVAIAALRMPSRYAFQMFLVIPILFGAWFAGFDLHFYHWPAFLVALIFYAALGYVASRTIAARSP
jgi:hypothetical protein